MKNIKLKIDGMSCSSCEGHVEKELEKIGAKKINVSAKNKSATFNISDDINKDTILKAIKVTGYIPGKIIFTDIKKGFFGRLFK